MANRTYYVLCADNCKFEGMTKEQIITAITQATGAVPENLDEAFITKIKEQNTNASLQVWVGTAAQYGAITEPAENCLYIITDESDFDDLASDVKALDLKVTEIEQERKDHLWQVMTCNGEQIGLYRLKDGVAHFIINAYFPLSSGATSLTWQLPVMIGTGQITGDTPYSNENYTYVHLHNGTDTLRWSSGEVRFDGSLWIGGLTSDSSGRVVLHGLFSYPYEKINPNYIG